MGDMNRHLALTFAGAAAIFVTTVSGAVAANVGILNVGAQKPVGQLTAATVGQLATPTPSLAAQSSATSQGASATGSVNGTVVDPARPSLERERDGQVNSPSSPTGDAAGSGALQSWATGSSNGPITPDGEKTQGPSVTAPTPTTSTPTTSRSSHERDDDHEDESEHEGDDDD